MEKTMFSSATVEWPTPQDFFDKCAAEFGPFDLDPCATAENAKASRYYTKQDDGLAQSWTGRVWMNPPYGRAIGAWIVCSEWKCVDNEWRRVNVKSAKIDGKKLKADTWYTLKNGKFVTAE